MRDLFGNPVSDSPAPCRRCVDRAHPDRPGTGPSGEICGSCAHYARVEYHDRTYRKCGRLRGVWTHGTGTDIRRNDPACSLFERSAA